MRIRTTHYMGARCSRTSLVVKKETRSSAACYSISGVYSDDQGPGSSKLYVFDVARARASPTSGSGIADTARLPLEGLSAFGGGLRIKIDRPLPHHTSANRYDSGPRLTGLGSGAREALIVCSAPTSDRRGGLVGGMTKAAICCPRAAPQALRFDVARARASATCTI